LKRGRETNREIVGGMWNKVKLKILMSRYRSTFEGIETNTSANILLASELGEFGV
jgi:hypothetical protein